MVAVTFIFTRCTDTCPVLTPMMSFVQDRLGSDFGTRIVFISVTVDPEHDVPDVLKEYAEAFGANTAGWFFATGDPDSIRDITRRYGVFANRRPKTAVWTTAFSPRLSIRRARCAYNISGCASTRRNSGAIC